MFRPRCACPGVSLYNVPASKRLQEKKIAGMRLVQAVGVGRSGRGGQGRVRDQGQGHPQAGGAGRRAVDVLFEHIIFRGVADVRMEIF